MLEKSSTICITSSEVDQINAGILPHRLEEIWGLTIINAQDIVQRGLFTLIGKEPETPSTSS